MTTILVLCCAQGAAAVPVAYDESIDGDLPVIGAPLPTFAFDLGTNSVSGTFGEAANGANDYDSFAFVIPPGAQLVAGQLALNDAVGDMVEGYWSVRAGSADYLGGVLLQTHTVNSPGFDVIASTPLASGVYNITTGQHQYAGPAPAYADYTFTFELTPVVPEPASACLLLVGAATGMVSRRRVNGITRTSRCRTRG
jgi:hypothetical protein